MAARKITEQPTPTTTTTLPQTGDFVLPPAGSGTVPKGEAGDVGATNDYQTYMEAQFGAAFVALKSISTIKARLDLLNKLYKKGWYKGNKPSVSGLTNEDIAVYRDLLIYQDAANLNASQLTKNIDELPDLVATSRVAQKTPAGDVDSLFKQVMQRDLGRAPRADEMAKFRQAYSSLEAGGNAPSLTAAAEEQIVSANTSESQAAQFAGFADVFEQMMRGA
jgi:hypothetical protein